jgi:hypothetical protein
MPTLGKKRRTTFAFISPKGKRRTSRCQAEGQRGFVAGRRFAGAFFAAGALALARARVRAFAVAFFFAAGLRPVVAAPDATREECLARCLVFFGAAASALDDSANAAMSATSSIFIVLRIMAVTITRPADERRRQRSQCDLLVWSHSGP